MVHKNTKAVFPILGQPPHLGNVVEILTESDKYDSIVVALSDKPVLISPMYAKQLLDTCFANNGKIKVVVSKTDWDMISMLPEEFRDCDVILTTSDALYTTMVTNGLENAVHVPKLLGYDDAYQMRAFQIGLAHDTLRGTMRLVNTKALYKKNKE